MKHSAILLYQTLSALLLATAVFPAEKKPVATAPSAESLMIPVSDDPALRPQEFPDATPVVWLTDFRTALARAALEKKPVLVDFTGSDWCGWCIRLDSEVFSQPAFKREAARRFVLLKVDFPRKSRLPETDAANNARLRDQFNVSTFPTVLLLNSQGQKLAEIRGFVRGGPAGFFAALNRQTEL